jgi:hypothetical protein
MRWTPTPRYYAGSICWTPHWTYTLDTTLDPYARDHAGHEPGAKRGYTPGRTRGTTWVVHQAYEG